MLRILYVHAKGYCMNRLRKPFYSSNGRDKSKKRGLAWLAIKTLFSISVKTRPSVSFIYLLFTGSCFGILFIIIGFVLLFNFEVNDHRTIILFFISCFIYGFYITLIQNKYLIPLGTARSFFFITFVLFFMMVNSLACFLGFDFIPWR